MSQPTLSQPSKFLIRTTMTGIWNEAEHPPPPRGLRPRHVRDDRADGGQVRHARGPFCICLLHGNPFCPISLHGNPFCRISLHSPPARRAAEVCAQRSTFTGFETGSGQRCCCTTGPQTPYLLPYVVKLHHDDICVIPSTDNYYWNLRHFCDDDVCPEPVLKLSTPGATV